MEIQHVRIIAVLVAAFAAAGCLSERRCVVPVVDDLGGDVRTKYRYRLTCVSYDALKDRIAFDESALGKCCPNVFSANGIPFVLCYTGTGNTTYDGSWTGFLSLCTLGFMPMLAQHMTEDNFYVELADDASIRATFGIRNMNDDACGPYPTAFLFFNDAPEVEGRRVFCEPTRHSSDKNPSMRKLFSVEAAIDFSRRVGYGYGIKGFEIQATALGWQAMAYALAVKLKELEDSGKVDAMLKKMAESRSSAPPHSIVRLERDSDNAFSYSFGIEMSSAPSDAKSAVRAILREFMDSVKEDYLDAHQNADAASLMVSFSNLNVNGRRIEGCASVLTIKPLSLSYDTNTRLGKMSVRFSPGQADEARSWIRKNIETLARDKNIALVTGEIPPAAKFYLGREELKDGNILEIEFKTE